MDKPPGGRIAARSERPAGLAAVELNSGRGAEFPPFVLLFGLMVSRSPEHAA